MDRDSLALLLAQGLSLAEIGRRFGKDESTVEYWVKKHGLKATHAERHAAIGGLDREALTQLIEEGLSQRQIAAKLGCSQRTVRYWLTRWGLRTRRPAPRMDGIEARAQGLRELDRECPKHGLTAFVIDYDDKHIAVLQFHHRDPTTKRFGLGQSGLTRSLASMRAEAGKCDLLCSNCHAEVEAGFTAPP